MVQGESPETPGVAHGLFELHPTLDAVSTFIYVKDRDRRVVSANRAFCEALGVPREELLGKTTVEFLGDAGPDSDSVDREVIESGISRVGIIEAYPATDGLRWVVSDKAPIRDSTGKVIGLVGSSVDVTENHEALERLRKSEERLRFLTEHMADILWTMDMEFHTTFVTPSVERVLGFTPEERMQQTLEEMVTPESVARILAELQHQLQLEASGTADPDRTLTIDVEYYRKDGSTLWMEMVIQAIRDHSGTLVGMVGVSRDISRRRQAEEALRRSEAQLRFLTGNMVDILWTMDMELHTTYISPSVERVLGFTPEEYTPLGLDRMVTTESVARIGTMLQRELAAESAGTANPERTITLEAEYYHKNGSTVWLEQVISGVRDEEGRLVGISGVARDVTDRKRAQQALRESEEKFRTLFEQSLDAIWSVRPDGSAHQVNQAWLDMFGYTREDLATLNVADLYAAPDGRADFLRRMEGKNRIHDEVLFRRKDGSVFLCQRSVVARRDNAGNVLSFQGVSRDITEERRAEQALRESEEKYHQLFALSIAPISLIAPDGRMIEANDAWYQLFGYSREDMDSFRVWDIYPTRELRDESMRRLLERGMLQDDEALMKRRDGTPVDVVRSMLVRRNPDGSVLGFQAIWRDITRQKAAERALLESEARFRMLSENLKDLVVRFDPHGRLTYANSALERLLQFRLSDVIGKTLDELALPEETARLAVGALAKTFARGELREGVYELATPSGPRVLNWQLIPEKDERGTATSVIASLRDVTELRNAQEQLRSLALRIQEAREQERSAIAHDLHDHFGQELTALKFDLDMLKRGLAPGDEQSHARVEDISRMVDQMSLEVRRVISDMRPGMLDDLGLCAAMEWQAEQFSERTGILCDLTTPADECPVPPHMGTALFRVFQELLSNVAHYAEATRVKASLSSDGNSVTLVVGDNGRGITYEELHSLDSLGILAIQERIRACRGTVTFEGEPGNGTTVTVVVPLHPDVGEGWQGRLGLA